MFHHQQVQVYSSCPVRFFPAGLHTGCLWTRPGFILAKLIYSRLTVTVLASGVPINVGPQPVTVYIKFQPSTRQMITFDG